MTDALDRLIEFDNKKIAALEAQVEMLQSIIERWAGMKAVPNTESNLRVE